MKQFHRKREVFEGAQKIFVAPGARAGAKIGFGHGCLGKENIEITALISLSSFWIKAGEIGATCGKANSKLVCSVGGSSALRFQLEPRGCEAIQAAPHEAI